MVVRCSNGVGFIVLEPEPSLRTGISVEVYDAANPDNLIDVLPDSFGRKWTEPRKGTGAGEFKVYASNQHVLDNPDILKAGNIVRLLLDRVPRFAFKIESRELVQIGEGDDSAIAWHIKGRGALSLLEDGQIYPAGGLTGSPERPFIDVTPGSAMLTLLGEARARANSILDRITDGFTATEDADNIPYDRTINLDERAGTDLLRVADRIIELAADVYMTPTLELRIVNTRGVDRTIQTVNTGPVVLQQGANIRELSRSEDAVIRNALLIETPGGFVERIEAASVSTYRRREAFISLGNITDTTQIDRAAEAVFERSANPAEAISISIIDAEGRRPYVDWGVGDWILAPDIEGNLERFRVASLTITEDEETGQIEAIPELATLTDDLEERLSKWLKSMARGTMGGTAAEVTEPNRASAEVIEAIDEGVDVHEATFLHPDELADLADVDVTGLTDEDALTYDAGAGDWVRVSRLLDDLITDVDAAAPVEGDVLYRNGAGLWVPVPGTKDDGDVPTIQADGSVAWEAPAGGGGGSGAASILGDEVIATAGGEFTDITVPSGISAIKVFFRGRGAADTNAAHIHFRFGDSGGIDTGNNYMYDVREFIGSSNASSDDAADHINATRASIPGGVSPSTWLDYGLFECAIMGAPSGEHLFLKGESWGRGDLDRAARFIGAWNNSNRLETIRVFESGGNGWDVGSRLVVVGYG